MAEDGVGFMQGAAKISEGGHPDHGQDDRGEGHDAANPYEEYSQSVHPILSVTRPPLHGARGFASLDCSRVAFVENAVGHSKYG